MTAPGPQRTDGAPAWVRRVTRASLAVGVVALAITVWVVGPGVLAAHLRAIGPWFLLLIGMEAAATCCDAGAVYAMTRQGHSAPSLRAVLVAQFAGSAVNSVTPGANLGEALKISLLGRAGAVQRSVAAVLHVALVSVATSLAVIAAGSAATALLFPLPRAATVALLGAAALAGAAAGALAVLERRGMLGALARLARRIRLVSPARVARWQADLDEVDARLRGDRGEHRGSATGLVVISQALRRALVWVTVVATGYSLDAPQLVAILSAGVLLNWIASVVPLGVGVAEGGHGVLFALIGAPASLGVALALARRVTQIVFAAIGFGVLAADRAADRIALHVDALDLSGRCPPATTSHAAATPAGSS